MNSNSTSDSQQVRLVYESSAPASPADNHLALPPGVSFLHAPAHGEPQILTVSPESFDDILILEPITTSRRQRRLLVLNPAAGLLLVKGQPVPRAAVLAETDEFSLNRGRCFYITLFHQRRLGPPDASLIGKSCPICRVAFTPRSKVYHCPCGGGIHLESADEEVGTLDCVPLCEDGLCPACRKQPIATQDGYSWLPELLHV